MVKIVFRKIKELLFGTGFLVGDKVYWDNKDDSYFSGEYVVKSISDKKGYVNIYNDKVKLRTVPYWYLKKLN